MAPKSSDKDSSSPSNRSSSSKSDKGSGSTHGSKAPAPQSLSSSDDANSPQSSPSKASPPRSHSSLPQSSAPPPDSSPSPSPSPSPPPPSPPPPHYSLPPSLLPRPRPSPLPRPPPSPLSPPPPSPSPSPSWHSGNSPSPTHPKFTSLYSHDSPSPDKATPTPRAPAPAPSTDSATSDQSPPAPSGDYSTGNGSSPTKSFRSPPLPLPMAFGLPPPPHSPGLSSGSGIKSKSLTGSSNSSSPSTSGGGDDNPVKYLGYVLAGVLIVALVAVVLVLLFRRKKKQGDVYIAPYLPPPNNFPMKTGADVHYYRQQPGMVNCPQDGFYNSRHPQSPLRHNYRNGSMNRLGTPDSGPKTAQIAFSFEMIMEITNGFSSQNVIGEGGFGCVYKACLSDGRAVAIKQLKAGSGQGEREFRAEVEIISRVHHRHLVSLVGYCISEQQRMLIYEFVPNGTLDHHLHGKGMPVLDWAKRLKIAIGAAKGLAYLHEDCSPKIIHRDIKSANILLDDAYEAKASDFGLARLTDDDNTHVSTRVMGTFGYMAPEYATSGKLTDRSDVFSFGVVLLELVTGRKPVDQTQPMGDESLVEWARPLLLRAVETGDFRELVDPRLERHFVESEMFRMIEAAAACVRHSAPNRPRMVQVVRSLDSGDQPADLSNGVRYGQSTVYDSGQYNEDIMRFRRMNTGSCGESEFDMYSGEYISSREMSGSRHAWVRGSSSCESESRAFNYNRSSTEDRHIRQQS